MFLYLRKEFEEEWKGKDPFEEVDKLQGKVYRHVKTRRTLQFELKGKSYFIKIHHWGGWGEIFKNLVQLKTTILGASNEYNAIRKLESLNVETMTAAAFGVKGSNPAKQNSFIITDDIQNCISLEDYCKPWRDNRPLLIIKLALLRKVAWISRLLHTNGINHRDYYICHFLLDPKSLDFNNESRITTHDPRLYLIDLHRAQIRNKTPRRWIVKDIAGIWFSAMDIGLTKNDIYRFIKIYSNASMRQELTDNLTFWKEINQKAIELYFKVHEKEPGCVFCHTK